MSTNEIQQFTGNEIIDELVRRVGPDEALRMYNEGIRCPVSSIAELRQRLIRGYVGGVSDPEGRIAL